MKPLTVRRFCLALVSVVATFSSMKLLNAQVPSSSAREFVTRFYKWYVPQALTDHATPTWRIALKDKGESFDPQLVRLLREDSAVEDKCEDLVGLDFDPFLDTQDPAEHYEVGKVKRQGNVYTAEIYSVQSGQKSSKPGVSAEFENNSGRWMFVNFHYPNGGDLVTTLKAPKLPCSSPRPVHEK